MILLELTYAWSFNTEIDLARDNDAYPLPGSRVGRAMRLGGMTSGVLGGMVVTGLGQIARGQRPSVSDSFLTPSTAIRITRDLGRMRGAAMKLGQMLSMDEAAVFPPEMTEILSRLRADAPHMPPGQLRDVLNAEWGVGWRDRFAHFDVRPFAAASIGQVHRATTHDGRDLAIKVQYPAVQASIDSDIDNVATLLRLPGLLPRHLDLSPVLAEAKRQLHREADYANEARHLTAFKHLLEGYTLFRVPDMHTDLSTPRVLAMTYQESEPIDTLADASQGLRDHVAAELIELVLRELFEYGVMQTDPNLANYRFDPTAGRVVLLDFGAVLPIAPDLAADFRHLLNAALDRDTVAIRRAMLKIGYFDEATPRRHQAMIEQMFDTAMAPLRQMDPFDFGKADLIRKLRNMGLEMGMDEDLTQVPPPATMFLHRKIVGIYLLAARLQARVSLRPMVERYR